MSTIKIEDLELSTLKCPENKQLLTIGSRMHRGLQLVINQDDKKTWRYRYQMRNGKRSSSDLGSYPSMSYEKAIKARNDTERLIDKGIDPNEVKRSDSLRKKQEILLMAQTVNPKYRFSALFAEYLEHKKARVTQTTIDQYHGAYNRELLPRYADLDVRLFDFSSYEDALFDVKAKKGKSAADKMHKTARNFFTYLVEKEIVHANPLLGRREIAKATKLPPRTVILSDQNLHDFFNHKLEGTSFEPFVYTALMVQIYTGLRVGEILKLQWSDILFHEQKMKHPAKVMKNGSPATTLISATLLRLLAQRKREVGDQYDGQVFPPIEVTKFCNKVTEQRGQYAFASHDLRRTVRTHLQAMGCDLETRSQITNHSEPTGKDASYDHALSHGMLEDTHLNWMEKLATRWEELKENPRAFRNNELRAEADAVLAEFADVIGAQS